MCLIDSFLLALGNIPEGQIVHGPPPDPLVLFTVLYGIYPCNFMAFLKDATGYLAAQGWQNLNVVLDSGVVQERSKVSSSVLICSYSFLTCNGQALIRRHHLHPSLVTNDLASELTDTHRWRRLESADVIAECDRNVAYAGEVLDPRGGGTAADLLRSTSTVTAEEPLAASTHSGLPVNRSPERSRSTTPHLPLNTHYANFQALTNSPLGSRSSSVDPMSLSLQLGLADSTTSSEAPSTVVSRRGSAGDPFLALVSSTAGLQHHSTSTNSQIIRLETELALLQSEVNFQTYLKQLHLAHMGTLHRAKVLDSGAEAERQSLVGIPFCLPIQLARELTTTAYDSIAQLGPSEHNCNRLKPRWRSCE